MKIPKRLRIGGHTFTVDCSKELPDNLGETKMRERKILISSDAHPSVQEATFIHELFHVLNTTLDGSSLGHALIDSLSEQFYQVLSDNKLLK